MNLDDTAAFKTLDAQNMYWHIDTLPDQLQTAWNIGQDKDLPEWDDIRQVLISGMGGSAIGADLLAAYAAPLCHVPVFVHRDYDLPAWAFGPETLVIASSHSGDTEETISSLARAADRGCRLIAVTTGGKIAQFAEDIKAPVWRFEHHGQPRAAVGFSFGLLLAIFARLHLLPDPQDELACAVQAMCNQQVSLRMDVPAARNPAKRMAGQLIGRIPVIFGAGLLAPVARRWKGQISEVAKAWGQFEFLPEADHNTLAGSLHPEELLSKLIVLFLDSASDHPRNRLRTAHTRQIFMADGLNSDQITAPDGPPLSNLWTLLHYGDYMAFYLAMAYGVDPTPVDALAHLKQALADTPQEILLRDRRLDSSMEG